ncbi:lysine decarboxylase [Herbaspirillum rubrisubalbicans]|uniref:Lysine decarboxylase n=1 Tax=Herbaspirillum rubrisubalbicans TaxID=80842 RepID=A0ABX9C1K6_9BURK|nr:TIGR00725 family protein [Herbaspirillum rubrisubalbicans]RAM64194.1 lysine decarboxylase [Herbaspirillum rubrisubalbicans]RAN49739.1 lysine decarboxylase [Herbaspirillum rubrisubalbicans]
MQLQDVDNQLSQETQEVLAQLAQRQAGANAIRQPVAIIGPGEATDEQKASAFRIARALAGAGVPIICGGKGGVMEATAQGARDAGGLVIGILPDADAASGNAYLSVVLPTGLGEARNAVIASSAICLIAVGGGWGTISEMALGLKWNKPVFATYDAEKIPGIQQFDSVEMLIFRAAGWLCG